MHLSSVLRSKNYTSLESANWEINNPLGASNIKLYLCALFLTNPLLRHFFRKKNKIPLFATFWNFSTVTLPRHPLFVDIFQHKNQRRNTKRENAKKSQLFCLVSANVSYESEREKGRVRIPKEMLSNVWVFLLVMVFLPCCLSVRCLYSFVFGFQNDKCSMHFYLFTLLKSSSCCD